MLAWFAGLSVLARVGTIVGLIALALAAYEGKIAWERADAVRDALASERARIIQAHAEESARQTRELLAVQAAAREAEAALEALRTRNENLLREIADASAKNNDRSCLDAAAAGRLQRLRDGSGAGGSRPAGNPPVPPRRPT